MQMDYTVLSAKSFDDTVAAVQEEVAAAGFKVQAVHDVSATLAEKGFERERVTIVEMCNAKHANAVLAADILIGLFLPCPVMVYAEGDTVKISTMRPSIMGAFFPNADMGNSPVEVESALVGIVDRAAA